MQPVRAFDSAEAALGFLEMIDEEGHCRMFQSTALRV
jgi:hypothetical protein